jgi:hypothetical protein
LSSNLDRNSDIEERMSRDDYERSTLDEALYDAREYLIAGLENQAEWWEHLGDAHRDYAALARLAVVQADELATITKATL